MLEAISIWLAVQAIGMIALPVTGFLFARLPGRGLGLAAPLGLLVAVYPAWLLASLGVLGYSVMTVLLGVGLLGALSALAAVPLVRRRPSLSVRAGRSSSSVRLWLVGQLLFTASFFGWTVMRSYSPDVWNTEKPMDMAFVNAIARTEWFPPHDPWLSSETINYYYFGHYIVAALIRLTHVEATVGFNLGVSLYYALSVTAVFTVAATLYAAARNDRAAPAGSPVLAGLAASALAMVLGNLAGGLQLLRHSDRIGAYDWWSPSRVIDNTANEFPFFSFLLADLHAHVMAVPFALVGLAFAMQLALAGPRLPVAAGRDRADLSSWAQTAGELGLSALLIGSLYAINAANYPIGVALVIIGLALWATTRRDRREWILASAWGIVWLSATVVLFLPYVLEFSPTTDGLGLVPDHAPFTRVVGDSLLIYGLPLWILATAYVYRVRESGLPRRYLVWLAVLAMFLLTLLAPGRLAGLALVLAVVAFGIYTTLARHYPQSLRFFWLLVTLGTGLIAAGELVYIRDAFEGTSFYRFNTVFKLGFQAWFLLAIAAGCAAVWARAWLPARARALWQAGTVVLIAMAAVYTVLGPYSKSDRFSRDPTLDGLNWLARQAPGDVAAIRWMRSNVDGKPTILEAVGDDFAARGHARVSTFTGLPTVLGWPGHELQWGHDLGTRRNDVRTIYATPRLETARALLERYGVTYVFVGSLERQDYPRAGMAKFGRLGRPVFSSGETTLFRVGADEQPGKD